MCILEFFFFFCILSFGLMILNLIVIITVQLIKIIRMINDQMLIFLCHLLFLKMSYTRQTTLFIS